ncbi:MAG: right-handed parallel beta-helix repeat-containing protein [Candidatus Bipolaricaulota bacterium]|nr:right-handed parallel beta-helix repeat-containing protein [Candidatus Bipolaricaulota bacterium]
MIFWIALAWTGFSHFTSTLWVDYDDPTCGGHSPCYQTIQEAVAAAQPGDTIRIRPGTYQGQIIISKDLTLSGESWELVLIHNKNDLGERPWEAIRVIGPATVTIEAVSIIDSMVGLFAKEAQITMRRARLSNNHVAIWIFNGQLTLVESQLSSNSSGVSLATESPLPNRIEGNQFHENSVAIAVGQSSRVIIRENKIYDAVEGDWLGHLGIGINLGGSAEASIQGNIIQNNATGTVLEGSARASIEGNQILGNALNGVIVQDSAQALLINNQISQNGFSSLVLGYSPLFLGDPFSRPQGFGVAVGLAASAELRQNRVEGNLFGIGAFQGAHGPTSKQLLLTPRLIAQGNYVQGNGWGIWLRGAEATLEGNEILQNDVIALSLDPQLWYWLDFFFPSAGVLIQGGQPLIQSNRIMRNSLGVVLQLQSSPTLLGNQILSNSEYGIALYQQPCFDLSVSNPLIEAIAENLKFQGKVSGEANELSSNSKADLCPPDYPWPPGFRK